MSLLTTASLVVTPNAGEEGTLFSIIPDTGLGDMSVTRATTATRVNSQGLVELVPYNLSPYSEDFSNPFWSLYQSSILSNNIASPNGTMTATKLIASMNSVAAIYSTGEYNEGLKTFSVYAKSGSQNIVFIDAIGIGGASAIMVVNLSTGALISSTFQNTNIENVGDGWYRISGTYTQLGGFLAQVSFGFGTSVSTNDYAYFWGYQIVEADTELPYQKTETRLNIPRLDYSNGTCPSLLVEPQRTNLCTYSEQFDNSAWITQFATVEANSIISPDGTQNAEKLNVTAFSYSGIYQNGNSASNKYTTSVFAKKGTKDWLYIMDASGTAAVAWFNISNGTLGSVSAGTSTIEDFGNGWYRCTYSDTNNVNNVYYQIGFSDANNSVQPTSSGYSYIYGFQREVGSYPTSYIPTTSASVTRNADVISKTGISSLIGQTEGTLFLDLNFKTPSGTTEGQIAITDNSGDNRVIIWNNFTLNTLGLQIKANGTNAISNVSLGSFVDGTRYKIAVAYKSGDTSVYVNGTQVISNTATFSFVSSLTDFILGGYYLPYNGHQLANASALWTTRLTNTQLEALTGTGFNTYAEMAEYYNYVLQ